MTARLLSARTQIVAVALIGTAVFVGWIGLNTSPTNAFDDAYITYRYADNLRRGVGLVYNPGEWVLGTTTPLYTLLLGLGGLVVSDLEWLGHWLGIVSWALAGWAGLALFWHTGRLRAGLFACILMSLQPLIAHSVGMETPFLVLLMLAAAWAWMTNRRWPMIIFSAALLLTRQDAALWLLCLGVGRWWREKRFPIYEAAGALLLILPWFVFAQARYGSFVPNSVIAKLGQTSVMPVGGQAPFPQMFWAHWTGGAHLALVIAMVILAGVGVWAALRERGRFAWLIAWTVLYLFIYTWLGVASFPWYFVPPLIGVSLITALGLGSLLGDAPLATTRREMRMALFAAGLACLGTIGWRQLDRTLSAVSERRGYLSEYRQVGAWLNQNTPANARVASIEIGVIGYLSQRPILDTMGLVSPEMTGHLLGWYQTLGYAVSQLKPEYVVALTETAWNGIIDQWWFVRHYHPVARFGRATLFEREPEAEHRYRAETMASYARGFSLVSIAAHTQTLEAGSMWDVQLSFEVNARPAFDCQLVVYLLNARSFDRVSLFKDLPLSGAYGCDVWQPGDRLSVPARLVIPEAIADGAYRLGVEIYDIRAGSNVALSDGSGATEVQVGWLRAGQPARVTCAARPNASACGRA
ncbi:MAG: ArnT family glycosyltransferase, partial [Candidatus Roseilinea sp.]|uniref:ArnT family glycosyltransferase n=1 Tax=Candidatus Roseilinea sp. TaxID=2838777 RepID=UPI00404AA49A